MGEEQQESAWLVRLRRPLSEEERPRAAEDQQAQTGQPDTAEGQQRAGWLADLREQQPEEQPRPAEELRIPLGQASAVEDLREQMIQAQGELVYEEKPPLARLFRNLGPAQRLILAVLLFLDVALCGCMALVMAGRVGLPF